MFCSQRTLDAFWRALYKIFILTLRNFYSHRFRDLEQRCNRINIVYRGGSVRTGCLSGFHLIKYVMVYLANSVLLHSQPLASL